MNKSPIRIIKNGKDNTSDVWPLPNVERQPDTSQPCKTNAFGKKANWVYETPEPETVEPQPLTAQEIENIRIAASEEGYKQGQEEGFAKGYEDGKIEGYETGKVQGIKAGNEQGLADGKETIDAQASTWQTLIEQLHHPLEIVEKNIEEQLLILVTQLTEAVVLQEAKTDPNILIAAITDGIKSLSANEVDTQICLNPRDIELVEAQFGVGYIQQQGWRLLPTPQLTQGGCQIENSTSHIDLQMKTRLKQVLEPFLENALHQTR